MITNIKYKTPADEPEARDGETTADGFNFLMSKGLFLSLCQKQTRLWSIPLHLRDSSASCDLSWPPCRSISVCEGKQTGFNWRQFICIVWIFVLFFVFLGWKFWRLVNKNAKQHKNSTPPSFSHTPNTLFKRICQNPEPPSDVLTTEHLRPKTIVVPISSDH